MLKHIQTFLLALILIVGHVHADQNDRFSQEGMIETLNLEGQTVSIGGQTYQFAQSIELWGENDQKLNFRGIQQGQWVQFNVKNASDQTNMVNTNTANYPIIRSLKVVAQPQNADKRE